MSARSVVNERGEIIVPEPPISRFLFASTGVMPWVWLVLRVFVGWQWLESGLGKLQSPAWMQGGVALKGFWQAAVAVPETGRPPISFDWYRNFIQFMLDNGWYTWFAKFIAVGETAIGIALILGALVGIAAFFGAFMNWNFIMAGSASTNGFLFALSIFLILAWRNAGWIGLDRWLLPLLGTPWYRTGDMPQAAARGSTAR